MSNHCQGYRRFNPDPELLGTPGESTSMLLRPLNEVAFAGKDTFYDMADIFKRVTLADKGIPQGEFTLCPTLDQLCSHYTHLLDAANRAREACAKYIFSCRRALASMDPNLNTQVEVVDTLDAFQGFRDRCREVRSIVDDAVAEWDITARKLRWELEPDSRMSTLEWLASVVVDLIAPQRRALLADLSSLPVNPQLNLRRFGDAYTALEDTFAAHIEAVRTTTPEVDAAIELRRNLKFVISRIIRLDLSFQEYRTSLVVATGQLHHWPDVRLFETPLRNLLAVEKDLLAEDN